MFCRKCGNELREGASFCTRCGEKVESPNIQTNGHQVNPNMKSSSKKLPTWLSVTLWTIFAITIFAVICWLSYSIVESKGTVTSTDLEQAAEELKSGKTNNASSTANNSNKSLSLDDVEVGKTFTSMSGINKATGYVFSHAWDPIKDTLPNAKWDSLKIIKSDGYGRFIVEVKYSRTSISEKYDYTYVLVAITDITTGRGLPLIWGDDYYYYTKSYGWGTPLTD